MGLVKSLHIIGLDHVLTNVSGDTVVVHVNNALSTSTNGTSIHFHGIRQNYTNPNDGVVSITQCPTPPGESITYTWKAVQYGSSWYHSHFSLQAWEGVYGGIVINGPATANYDEDLGLLILSDWSHQTVDELWTTAETAGTVTLDTALINGTNVWGDDGSSDQVGYRYNVSLTEGNSYRMRVLNSALDTHFKFSIDNHTLTVIAADFVPITPFTTEILSIGIGKYERNLFPRCNMLTTISLLPLAQRYDIIVTADQAAIADSFWIRSIPQGTCSFNNNTDNIKGIVYYGDSTTTPTTSQYDDGDDCDDMDASNLLPYISKIVSASTWAELEDVTLDTNDDNLYRWYLNSSTFEVQWADPTLLKVYDGSSHFSDSENIIELDEANEWAYLVIETSFAVPHPIHLHGHDFFVLAQGTGTYNDTVSLKLDNPPRRDTAMLPASGYLALAFQTDNPGVWLMHCHIGWHTSEGLALQWVERESDIPSLDGLDAMSDNCQAWSDYQSTVNVVEEDSGI